MVSAGADSNSGANRLFVEAVKLVKSIENVEGLEEKAVVLEDPLRKLNEIIDEHPSSDLAVKLISGQDTGGISLEGVGEMAKQNPVVAARLGDADAQHDLSIM